MDAVVHAGAEEDAADASRRATREQQARLRHDEAPRLEDGREPARTRRVAGQVRELRAIVIEREGLLARLVRHGDAAAEVDELQLREVGGELEQYARRGEEGSDGVDAAADVRVQTDDLLSRVFDDHPCVAYRGPVDAELHSAAGRDHSAMRSSGNVGIDAQ